jgi:hypothetical protein
MTGKDLIIYILMNDLEDEPVFKDGKFIGFVTAGEVAMKMNVGIATVHAWIQQKRLDSITIGNTVYIPANFELKGVDNDG